jgi:hypothetical protein
MKGKEGRRKKTNGSRKKEGGRWKFLGFPSPNRLKQVE